MQEEHVFSQTIDAIHIVQRKFGDEDINEYVLNNAFGLEMKLIEYGATLTSVRYPDRFGHVEELTLCFTSMADLNSLRNPYYGCTVGRVANRIKEGKFSLEGKDYQLEINNGPNHLHGGLIGFNSKIWKSEIVEGSGDTYWKGVKFSYLSNDGEENYPGNLNVEVTYALTVSGDILMTYEAVTDAKTPVNLTNHCYWNLSGNLKRKVLEHKLKLSCAKYLPVTADSIPTGELADVAGTVFDFTGDDVVLGERIPLINGGGKPGVDHCFVVNGDAVTRTFGEYSMRHIAELSDKVSGRTLTVWGTQPGVQVYTGNFLSEDLHEAPHTVHNAICLETQHFPDAVNQPSFPTVILLPNQKYSHASLFSLGLMSN